MLYCPVRPTPAQSLVDVALMLEERSYFSADHIAFFGEASLVSAGKNLDGFLSLWPWCCVGGFGKVEHEADDIGFGFRGCESSVVGWENGKPLSWTC